MDGTAVIAAGSAAAGFFVGGTVGLVLHEAAHAGAAWLVGLEPRLISIGHGKILVRRRLGRVWFVMRAVPLYGFAARLPDPVGRPVRQAIVVGAGPLASLAMFALVATILVVRLGDGSIAEIESLIGVGSAASGQLIASLFPWSWHSKGRRQATDGFKLWRIARHGDIDGFAERYARLLHTDKIVTDVAQMPSALAPELLYQLGRSDLKDAWARDDAASVLTGLLRGDDLSARERRFLIERLGLGAHYER